MKVKLTMTALAIAAMADFQTAGTDFATGIQSSAAEGEAPLSTGTQEIKNFSASVKATCN